MEAWTAEGAFIGAYPTRKEAASALYKVLYARGLRGGWATTA